MEIAIIGLPKSGKTTLFKALTRGKDVATEQAGSKDQLHVGVTKVPDLRLDTLAHMFQPYKVTPVEIKYWDFPAALQNLTKGAGLGGQYLNILQKADALLHVVRTFDDPAVPHVSGSVDPHRDVTTMEEELAFSDMAILERRMQRIDSSLKGAKGHEKDVLLREKAFLQRIKEVLERGIPIRQQDPALRPDSEKSFLVNYQFLTDKPLLSVFNIDEAALPQKAHLEEELAAKYQRPGVKAIALCGKLEMELSQLTPEEEMEFRESLGVKDSGVDRVIRLSYELLGLVSFFTYVSREVRSWTVPANTPAVKAAGRIHSDIERGFIRAEVIAFDDLIKCGSIAEGRKQGLLRLEGKTYPVKDGDVITFLFNV